VVPVAEENGINLAVHPDDPPFPLLGLPRIMSTQEDFNWLMETQPSINNGITFCAGSLSARADNDLLKMIDCFGQRIHFAHLRSTQRLENGDFYEASHLAGDADLTAVIHKLYDLLKKTQKAIPVRPDHGHKLLDDFKRETNP
jgi:mannonate dehydratase